MGPLRPNAEAYTITSRGYRLRSVSSLKPQPSSVPGPRLSQFDCGFVLPDRDELEVVGSEGSLFLDDPWHARTPVIEVRREDGVEEVALEPQDSYRLELENLGEAIAGSAEPLLGPADAVGQARAIAALYRSAETGAPVSLD